MIMNILYTRGQERMTREPGVALLMIASGSQIKLVFETLKVQYFSQKLYLYVEGFRASFTCRAELGRRRRLIQRLIILTFS